MGKEEDKEVGEQRQHLLTSCLSPESTGADCFSFVVEL